MHDDLWQPPLQPTVICGSHILGSWACSLIVLICIVVLLNYMVIHYIRVEWHLHRWLQRRFHPLLRFVLCHPSSQDISKCSTGFASDIQFHKFQWIQILVVEHDGYPPQRSVFSTQSQGRISIQYLVEKEKHLEMLDEFSQSSSLCGKRPHCYCFRSTTVPQTPLNACWQLLSPHLLDQLFQVFCLCCRFQHQQFYLSFSILPISAFHITSIADMQFWSYQLLSPCILPFGMSPIGTIPAHLFDLHQL